MLVGCGCQCEPEQLSSVPSGASDSLNSQISEIASNSLPGPPLSFCGVCRNLPAEWSITIPGDWFLLNPAVPIVYPNRFNDCSAAFAGTFTLRPYGQAAMTDAARQYLNLQGFPGNVCTVWQSDEKAIYSHKENADGSPTGCRNTIYNWPRVELVSWAIDPGNNCSETYFILFVWHASGYWPRAEYQMGFSWGWTVPQQPGCETRNCVRCWQADFDFGAVNMPVGPGAFNPYQFDQSHTRWQQVLVCPA
jgi:hypothetical protein